MYLYRTFASRAEIDAEYDVEKQVPDFMQYAAWYEAESAKARDELTCVLDVPFGPTLAETMDVFPAARPGAPVVVFVHGGYWRILSAKEFSFAARGLQALGYTVAVTNYALAPRVGVGEITRQGRAAVAALAKTADRYNGDPDRILVTGHSAGGQQSAMLAMTDWEGDYGLPADTVKGAVPISGLFDLAPLAHSWLAETLRLDAWTLRAESPILQIPPADERTLPPLLVTVGGIESAEFRRQSADFVTAWRAAGHAAETVDQPERNHFTAITDLADPQAPLTRAIDRFACGLFAPSPARAGEAQATQDAGAQTERPAGPRAWDTGPATRRFPTFGAPKPRLGFEKTKR